MSTDPLDTLPPNVRRAVDRFQAARSRVAIAMIATPLLSHQAPARKKLLEDLATVAAFVGAIDTIHSETPKETP